MPTARPIRVPSSTVVAVRGNAVTATSATKTSAAPIATGRATRIDFTGVTGAPYAAYEYDYIGGVYAGAKFTFTSAGSGKATGFQCALVKAPKGKKQAPKPAFKRAGNSKSVVHIPS